MLGSCRGLADAKIEACRLDALIEICLNRYEQLYLELTEESGNSERVVRPDVASALRPLLVKVDEQ